MEEGQIVALWLDSGKRIDCAAGVKLHGGNFIVRNSPTSVLLVSGAKVQSVETSYPSEQETDRMFDPEEWGNVK